MFPGVASRASPRCTIGERAMIRVPAGAHWEYLPRVEMTVQIYRFLRSGKGQDEGATNTMKFFLCVPFGSRMLLSPGPNMDMRTPNSPTAAYAPQTKQIFLINGEGPQNSTGPYVTPEFLRRHCQCDPPGWKNRFGPPRFLPSLSISMSSARVARSSAVASICGSFPRYNSFR